MMNTGNLPLKKILLLVTIVLSTFLYADNSDEFKGISSMVKFTYASIPISFGEFQWEEGVLTEYTSTQFNEKGNIINQYLLRNNKDTVIVNLIQELRDLQESSNIPNNRII